MGVPYGAFIYLFIYLLKDGKRPEAYCRNPLSAGPDLTQTTLGENHQPNQKENTTEKLPVTEPIKEKKSKGTK